MAWRSPPSHSTTVLANRSDKPMAAECMPFLPHPVKSAHMYSPNIFQNRQPSSGNKISHQCLTTGHGMTRTHMHWGPSLCAKLCQIVSVCHTGGFFHLRRNRQKRRQAFALCHCVSLTQSEGPVTQGCWGQCKICEKSRKKISGRGEKIGSTQNWLQSDILPRGPYTLCHAPPGF